MFTCISVDMRACIRRQHCYYGFKYYVFKNTSKYKQYISRTNMSRKLRLQLITFWVPVIV